MSRKAVVSAIAALSLGLGASAIAAPATAAPSSDKVSTSGRAMLKSSVKSVTDHSDAEVLQLLLAAQGPVADRNPQLKQLLGFDPDKPSTDQTALNQVIKDYVKYNPSFRSQTVIPLQSGDPERVNEALRTFSVSFNKFVKVQNDKAGTSAKKSSDQANAKGWTWMGANVVVYANAAAVANAVAYANAGVATFAVAALVVVVWYLEDGSPTGSAFEHDHFVKSMTDAFA